MPNTSATGGPLAPLGTLPPPLEDAALDQFLQQLVVGIVGLPGAMVRPRWQPEPPNIPAFGTDWAAIGVTETEADTFAAEIHYCDNAVNGPGHDLIVRQEILTILTSFYGPNAGGNAALMRDGFSVAQNREVLTLANMGLVEVGKPVTSPQLPKQRWLRRIDIPFRIRRQILRNYPVLNLLKAETTLRSEAITIIRETP